MKLPTKFGLHSFNGFRWRWRASHNHPNGSSTRNTRIELVRCINNRICYSRSTAQQGDSVLFNTTKYFRSINFAKHNMSSTHRGNRVHHAPTIAMKLGKSMQVDVAIIDSHVPTKRCCVQPNIAVGQLDTFRPCSSATGVVDRRSCIFVWRPRPWLCGIVVQQFITFRSDDETMFGRNIFERIFKLRVDNQHFSATMLNDVANFFR